MLAWLFLNKIFANFGGGANLNYIFQNYWMKINENTKKYVFWKQQKKKKNITPWKYDDREKKGLPWSGFEPAIGPFKKNKLRGWKNVTKCMKTGYLLWT